MDSDGIYFCNDTCRIIVGDNLYHLLGIMNSELFFYSVKRFYGGGSLGESGVRMKHTFFENFPCIPISDSISGLAQSLMIEYSEDTHRHLNDMISQAYSLTDDEKSFIQIVLNQ